MTGGVPARPVRSSTASADAPKGPAALCTSTHVLRPSSRHVRSPIVWSMGQRCSCEMTVRACATGTSFRMGRRRCSHEDRSASPTPTVRAKATTAPLCLRHACKVHTSMLARQHNGSSKTFPMGATPHTCDGYRVLCAQLPPATSSTSRDRAWHRRSQQSSSTRRKNPRFPHSARDGHVCMKERSAHRRALS